MHPERKHQFVLEMDASDSGVRAVLTLRPKKDEKLHPCSFFSQCLSLAQQNYDIGNRELLAMKLALMEALARKLRNAILFGQFTKT